MQRSNKQAKSRRKQTNSGVRDERNGCTGLQTLELQPLLLYSCAAAAPDLMLCGAPVFVHRPCSLRCRSSRSSRLRCLDLLPSPRTQEEGQPVTLSFASRERRRPCGPRLPLPHWPLLWKERRHPLLIAQGNRSRVQDSRGSEEERSWRKKIRGSHLSCGK